MFEFQVFHGWGDKLEIFTGRPGVSQVVGQLVLKLVGVDVAGLGICLVTVARV